MIIGIPRERLDDENRVGLSPAAVHVLVQQGHEVQVEQGAGAGSGFTDDAYSAEGAVIAHAAEEVYGRADLLVKVQYPTPEEYDWLRQAQVVMAYLHLPTRGEGLLGILRERACSAVDYAAVALDNGEVPVLASMSRIAGRMVPQIAARYLQADHGGKGILLGGLPAVPPAEAVVLGGGTAGRNAARALLGSGARVSLLDVDYDLLRELHWHFEGRVTTYITSPYTLTKVLGFADVVVGAVRIREGRTPVVVDRAQVETLREGSVVIDLSIDQGGCFETSRPTRLSDPTYVRHGVTHFCVPNVPSLVARSATHALTNAVLPYVSRIAADGLDAALAADVALRRGTGLVAGRPAEGGAA
jgi:alanine dehydrogenase